MGPVDANESGRKAWLNPTDLHLRHVSQLLFWEWGLRRPHVTSAYSGSLILLWHGTRALGFCSPHYQPTISVTALKYYIIGSSAEGHAPHLFAVNMHESWPYARFARFLGLVPYRPSANGRADDVGMQDRSCDLRVEHP